MAFKASMSSFYHEARSDKKKIKQLQEEAQRRAERRAEVASTNAEHPLNYLVVSGRPCKMHKNADMHASLERMEGLIPWNGHQDNLIDRCAHADECRLCVQCESHNQSERKQCMQSAPRSPPLRFQTCCRAYTSDYFTKSRCRFDGRALLDFYRDPQPGAHRRAKSSNELKLEELLMFEDYRDLIRLMAMQLSEEEGLEYAALENLEIRASARSAAADAVAAMYGRKFQNQGAEPNLFSMAMCIVCCQKLGNKPLLTEVSDVMRELYVVDGIVNARFTCYGLFLSSQAVLQRGAHRARAPFPQWGSATAMVTAWRLTALTATVAARPPIPSRHWTKKMRNRSVHLYVCSGAFI